MSSTAITQGPPDTAMKWPGALLLTAIGTLHFVVMNFHPEEYIEANYWLGVLMFSGGVAAYVAAVLLFRADQASVAWGWLIGEGTAALMVVGLILSRTAGLFGFHHESFTWEGVLALILEFAFLGMAVVWMVRQAFSRR